MLMILNIEMVKILFSVKINLAYLDNSNAQIITYVGQQYKYSTPSIALRNYIHVKSYANLQYSAYHIAFSLTLESQY